MHFKISLIINGRKDRQTYSYILTDLKSKNGSWKSPVVVEGIRTKDEGSTRSLPRLPSFIFSFNISRASLGSSFIWCINLNSATMLPLLEQKDLCDTLGKEYYQKLARSNEFVLEQIKRQLRKLFEVMRCNWLNMQSQTG